MEQLKGIMFVDIETVPVVRAYNNLNESLQKEWLRKAKTIKAEAAQADPEGAFAEKAGVYAEFAKVVCIGIGSMHEKDGQWSIRLKAITGDDEAVLLRSFSDILQKFMKHYPDIRFCGHNIKEFDIPFLSRRMIIKGIPLPVPMQLQGKKPWEITHIDTMELWRFGDYKNFTSLSLLAAVLGIPSPKGDIDGSMVASVYYNDNDLARIGKYCIQDVLTAAKVYLKLAGIFDIEPTPIIVAE